MRDYAKLKDGLWTGDLADEIRGDPWCQALAPYLIGGPHGNMVGIYRLPVSYITEDLGWTTKQVEDALAKLEEHGFCRYDKRHRVVWVREHARIEWGEDPNPKDKRVTSLSRSAPKILRSLHKSSLAGEFLQRYSSWQGLVKGLPSPPDGGTEPTSEALAKQEQESDQESELEQEIEQEKNSCTELAADDDSERKVKIGGIDDDDAETIGPTCGDRREEQGGRGRGGDVPEPQSREGYPGKPQPGGAGGESRGSVVADPAKLTAHQAAQKSVESWFAREEIDPPTHKRGKSKGQVNYGVLGRWLKACEWNGERCVEILRELQAREKIPSATWAYTWTMMKEWGASGPPTSNGKLRSSSGGRSYGAQPEDEQARLDKELTIVY